MRRNDWFLTFGDAHARALLGGSLRFVRPDPAAAGRGVVVYVAGGDSRLWALSAEWSTPPEAEDQGGAESVCQPATAAFDIWTSIPAEGVTQDDGHLFGDEVRDVPLKSVLIALGCLERGDAVAAAAAIGANPPARPLVATEMRRALVGRYGSMAEASRLTAQEVIAEARQALVRPKTPDPEAVLLANAHADDIRAGQEAVPPEYPTPSASRRIHGLLMLLDILQWGPPGVAVVFTQLGRSMLRDLVTHARRRLPDFDPASPRRDLERTRHVSDLADRARLLHEVMHYAAGRQSASRSS